MQLKLSEQLALGGWLGMALFSSIMQRSLSAGVGFVVIGLFFSVPLFAQRGFLSSSKIIRWVAQSGRALFICTLFVVLLTGVERAYLLEADTYPAWLATDHIAAIDTKDLAKIRSEYCAKNDPIEILPKANGVQVLRCGFNWLTASTFVVDARKGAL